MNETYSECHRGGVARGRPAVAARPSSRAVRARLAAARTLSYARLWRARGGYEGRGIEVKETANGFRIQVRRELGHRNPPPVARASAALLAGDARDARADRVSPAHHPRRDRSGARRGRESADHQSDDGAQLGAVVGHARRAGRPELLGTTREFLDYFGLKTSTSCRRSRSFRPWAISTCSSILRALPRRSRRAMHGGPTTRLCRLRAWMMTPPTKKSFPARRKPPTELVAAPRDFDH